MVGMLLHLIAAFYPSQLKDTDEKIVPLEPKKWVKFYMKSAI